MARMAWGFVVGAVLGAALALWIHYTQRTGCSTRLLHAGGTVQTCGYRTGLAIILLPMTLIGSAAGGGLGMLLDRARRGEG